MYSVKIPHKDFRDAPRNETHYFNLTEHEFFKLLEEFGRLFRFREQNTLDDFRQLETGEVVAFYNDFERVILAAWGIPSDDGRHFRKSGRYDFEESAAFHAYMKMLLEDQNEVTRFITEITPKGLEEVAKASEENLKTLAEAAKQNDNATLQTEVERLRAELAAKSGDAPIA